MEHKVAAIISAVALAMAVAAVAKNAPTHTTTTFVDQLSALAARCELADAAARPNNPRDRRLQEHAIKWANDRQSCAASAKTKAKPYYRAALAAVPAARDLITRTYARWLAYIDHVGLAPVGSQESDAQRSYERAADDLRAYIDAQ